MHVQDAETAIMQELDDMRNAENARWRTRKLNEICLDILNAIRDSLSECASSNDKEEDGENDKDNVKDTELRKLNKDDKPRWVMSIICKTVHHYLQCCQPKQMWVDELKQTERGQAADYFRQSDIKYRMAELEVQEVVKPQPDLTAATPSPTTFGKLMQTLDIIHGQW